MKFTTNWSSSSNPRNGGNSKAPRVQIVRRPEDALHDMRDMRTLPSVSSLVEPKTARFDSMMDGRTVPPSNSLPSPPPSNEPSVDSSTRSSFDLPLQQLSPRVHPSPLKLAARSSDHPLPPPPSSENTPTFSVQPPFEPLLMSAPPSCPVDPAKTIVTLETCTDTYRTTLQTLTARPSHLANFLLSLLVPASETSSIYSGTSDPPPPAEKGPPNALLQGSLSSLRGQTHQSVPVIHIFLDRASAPYPNVLAYLRSSKVAVSAIPPFMSRLSVDTLTDLRDESYYLGLDELSKLCNDTIRRRYSLSSRRTDIGSGAPVLFKQLNTPPEIVPLRLAPKTPSYADSSTLHSSIPAHIPPSGTRCPPQGWI